jgi:hypothetical protein
MKQIRVLGSLLGFFCIFCTFLHAQTAPSTYSAYTGTDVKTIPPAPALGPANSVIQDPTFGSMILRVTDPNTAAGESFVSTDAGSHRAWNADSTAIKLTGPHGDTYWMEFSPGTFKVGDGSNYPVPHPLAFSSGWEWSTVDPDIIYFLNGNQIAKFNKATGLTANLGGPPNGDPVAYMAVVIGQDNWVCSAAGPGFQDSYTEIYCVNPISPGTSEFIDVYHETINGVPQSDPNWPTAASGQTLGIHEVAGGTGASWLEVTFHGQGWGANGGAVFNLATHTWSVVSAADYYWAGHVSMGNGKYVNSAGSIDGRDSRGMLVRDPDSLMNSGEYQFVEQPPDTLNRWCDSDHNSWLNSMINPNAPILSSRYMANTPNCSFTWTGEIVAAAVDGSNTVWRFAHNHDGGCYYGEGFAQISNDGNWALFSSYWDGTLGPDTSFGCQTRIDTFIVQLSGGSSSVAPASLKASYLGVTGQDYVGPQGQVTPDGVPDWHIQLQGLRGTPVQVQITSTAGGVWQTPYNGVNWVISAQYGASGSGDLFFEPWSTPGFHVKVWYSDSTTDEADATATTITTTLRASFLGATGQDCVGPQGQLTPDGVLDWHIQLQGLRGTPVQVQITSVAGGVWQTPYNGVNWVISAQYGPSGSGDLFFEPWSSTGFHIKVWYSDSTTDEADAS